MGGGWWPSRRAWAAATVAVLLAGVCFTLTRDTAADVNPAVLHVTKTPPRVRRPLKPGGGSGERPVRAVNKPVPAPGAGGAGGNNGGAVGASGEPAQHVDALLEPAPTPLGPYAGPPTGDHTAYNCSHQAVLWANNYVEGLGNWLKAFFNLMHVAARTGRAVVEPCMLNAGSVACSYAKLVDTPNPGAGYKAAYARQKATGMQPVFPMSYYFNVTRNAKLLGATIVPYKQFISCAVAAQQARDRGEAPPSTAGPPTERLRLDTLYAHHYSCGLYVYDGAATQSYYGVSEDVEAKHCATIDPLAEARGVSPLAWLQSLADPVVGFIDVWNRYVHWGISLPSTGQFHISYVQRLEVASFHRDAMTRFADYLVRRYHVPLAGGHSDPLHALSVYHWRSEGVRPDFGNDTLSKCGRVLGMVARDDLSAMYHSKTAVGVVMSDLPSTGGLEKWVSYVKKGGHEARTAVLPQMLKSSGDRLVEYSRESGVFSRATTRGFITAADEAAMLVDVGVVTVRELVLALYAQRFTSCGGAACSVCCRPHSAFVRLVESGRKMPGYPWPGINTYNDRLPRPRFWAAVLQAPLSEPVSLP